MKYGMISQKVLGAAETNVSAAAHNFGHESEDWGGIPIVILFDDDCQIPPTLAAGAVESLTGRNQKTLGVASNGRQQFWNLSKQVMELSTRTTSNPFRYLTRRLRVASGEEDMFGSMCIVAFCGLAGKI